MSSASRKNVQCKKRTGANEDNEKGTINTSHIFLVTHIQTLTERKERNESSKWILKFKQRNRRQIGMSGTLRLRILKGLHYYAWQINEQYFQIFETFSTRCFKFSRRFFTDSIKQSHLVSGKMIKYCTSLCAFCIQALRLSDFKTLHHTQWRVY